MKSTGRFRLLFSMIFLASGAVMLVFGLLRGEAQELLRKATIVCLECIGIG